MNNIKNLLKLLLPKTRIKNKNFIEKLNDGIEKILNSGNNTQFINPKTNLDELLLTASKINQAFKSINPKIKPLNLNQFEPDERPKFFNLFKHFSKSNLYPKQLSLSVCLILIIFSSSTFGLYYSGSNALPGETLYWVKNIEDNISLRMQKNNFQKAKKHMEISASTVHEMKQLIEKNKIQDTKIALKKVQDNLTIAGQIYNKQINYDHTVLQTIKFESIKNYPRNNTELSQYQLTSTNLLLSEELTNFQNYINLSMKNDSWQIKNILLHSCKNLIKSNQTQDSKITKNQNDSDVILCKTVLSYHIFFLSLQNTYQNSTNIN